MAGQWAVAIGIVVPAMRGAGSKTTIGRFFGPAQRMEALRMTGHAPATDQGRLRTLHDFLYLTRLAVNFEERPRPSTSRVKAISSPSTVPV